MAQFSQLIITKSGQELLAKVLVDGGKLEFTRICVSEAEIAEKNLEQLTELPEIKQESRILDIVKTSSSAVKVEASFSNRELSAGYFMRTLGLFAKNGGSEVLYAAAAEVSGHCFMPAYNGVTVSGALIQLVTSVGNAENISFEVDPAGTATIARLAEEIAKHNSDANAHADIIGKIDEKISNLLTKRIIATRERDPSKPDYGIGGSDEISAALEIGTFTGTADTTVVVSGVEYDALNLSHSGENVPDGNIIFNTEV